jgi:VWFA-related protein
MRLKTSLRVSGAAVLALSLMLTASAQQPTAQPPKPAAQQPTSQQPPAKQAPQKQSSNDNGDTVISVTTQLVIETVTVTDKSGKGIEGLTAKDFAVTEDNVPQSIKFFDYEKLPETPEPLPPAPENITVLNKFPKSRITSEQPGSTRYKDHRLLALYFDMSALPPLDQLRSLDGARKFIKENMTKADLVAIMLHQGGAVDVLQDFTDDRNRLLTILETIAVGESQGFDEVVADDSAADTGAAFGQDDSEFNLFTTDRQLAALQTAATMLGHLSERKQLLYFASGLHLNGLDNQAQLHATVNAAVRAGVQFWTIDARGLVAFAPLGLPTAGTPGGQGMYSGSSSIAFTGGFQASQDTMYTLAGDTGGKALLDNNDLSVGIVNAQKAVSSYYIIGYYASNQNLDGKFRKVKIMLNNGLAANIGQGRQGYYAGKVFAKFTTADKDRQLEEAMMLGDPITDLTIAMEVNYFQLNKAEYYIPFQVKIPGKEMALARKGGAERAVIDYILEVKDDYGATMQNIRDKIEVKLGQATADQWAKSPVEYSGGFTLLPSKYVVKLVARENETGRIGTYISSFTVPDLMKEEKRIPISSVVLSSQRVAKSDVLYNAGKGKTAAAADAANPMISEGAQLIPSVTRVFSKSKDMYVFLQAYERNSTTQQPLVAFVTFLRGQTKVFETSPIAVTDGLDPKTRAVPLRFDLALDKLQPGQYQCQVTVLDTNGQKAAFWQAPIMLVP